VTAHDVGSTKSLNLNNTNHYSRKTIVVLLTKHFIIRLEIMKRQNPVGEGNPLIELDRGTLQTKKLVETLDPVIFHVKDLTGSDCEIISSIVPEVDSRIIHFSSYLEQNRDPNIDVSYGLEELFIIAREKGVCEPPVMEDVAHTDTSDLYCDTSDVHYQVSVMRACGLIAGSGRRPKGKGKGTKPGKRTRAKTTQSKIRRQTVPGTRPVMPQRRMMEFRYLDPTYIRGAGPNQYFWWTLRLNAPWDPDPLLGSDQSTGLTAAAAFYESLRVRAVSIDTQITNLKATVMQSVMVLSTQSFTGVGSFQLYASQPFSSKIQNHDSFGSGGEMRSHRIRKFQLQKLFGSPSVYNAGAFDAAVLGTPTDFIYVNFGITTIGAALTTSSVNQTTSILYHCQMYDLNVLTDSNRSTTIDVQARLLRWYPFETPVRDARQIAEATRMLNIISQSKDQFVHRNVQRIEEYSSEIAAVAQELDSQYVVEEVSPIGLDTNEVLSPITPILTVDQLLVNSDQSSLEIAALTLRLHELRTKVRC